jgi:DNA-binding GntR family transcriptional regulator
MATLQPLKTKPESLTQMVYHTIREAIVSKQIVPGTPVSEASLARDLQVSKTPVREALLRLQSVGLIEPHGGRGVRVVSPSREIIEQAYEIRGVLESGAARMAAVRATTAQKQEVLDAASASLSAAESGDASGFVHWDGIFHLTVAESVRNPRLLTLVENALSLTSVLRQRDAPAKTDATTCARQHVAIAEAIIAGDSSEAAEVAAQHAHDVQNMVVNLASLRDEDSVRERS